MLPSVEVGDDVGQIRSFLGSLLGSAANGLSPGPSVSRSSATPPPSYSQAMAMGVLHTVSGEGGEPDLVDAEPEGDDGQPESAGGGDDFSHGQDGHIWV